MEAHTKRKRPQSLDGAPAASGFNAAQKPPEAENAKRARLSTGASITQQITIHRVRCSRTQGNHASHPPSSYYSDIPAMIEHDNQSTALHGQFPIRDVDNYLDGNFGISIAVFVDYDCEAYHARIKDAFIRLPMPSMPGEIGIAMKPYFRVLQNHGPPADADSERLQLSESLERALRMLQGQHTGISSKWDFDKDLVYPYPKLYHSHRAFLGPSKQNLELQQQIDLEVLSGYIKKRVAAEYEELEVLSAMGMVRQNQWPMLFQPDDTVVTILSGQYRAFTLKSCRSLDRSTLELDCWTWEYDGNFFRKHITIPTKWPSESSQVAIKDLSVYPVRHAAEGIKPALRKRGDTFWSCRRRKYVNYDMPLHGLGSQLVRSQYWWE
jgi:hypothetical protein